MATRKKSVAKKSTSAKKKKKPFMPMEIAKVELNRDQAVLTCCDSVSKVGVDHDPQAQCWVWPACPEDGAGTNFSSS